MMVTPAAAAAPGQWKVLSLKQGAGGGGRATAAGAVAMECKTGLDYLGRWVRHYFHCIGWPGRVSSGIIILGVIW